MELGQIVFRWEGSFSFRLLGVDSIHLRGGDSFLSLFFWGLSCLLYPLYALWLFASFLMHFLFYLSKKKKKKKEKKATEQSSWMDTLCHFGCFIFLHSSVIPSLSFLPSILIVALMVFLLSIQLFIRDLIYSFSLVARNST